MIVFVEEIVKGFGAHPVLEGVTAQIDNNQRIGLIGANGAGKTTLLKTIYGDYEPDKGRVVRGSGKTVGFLRQHSGLEEENTIKQEMNRVFEKLHTMESTMREDEIRMTVLNPNLPEYEEIAKRYADMQGQFEVLDGYSIDAQIARVLNGMGFGDMDENKPIRVLSGGEKTRLALAKLLLERPDLLILDEPTNHLDFPTMVWLEDYLENYPGALLIVSHDRFFLNKLCNRIWELENFEFHSYPGNYTQYLTLKEERITLQQRLYEEQQVEIAKYKDFIARNLVRASTTKRAQARQKALERMVIIPRPLPPPKPPALNFRTKKEPVSDVLMVEELALSVGEPPKHLFSRVNLHVKRGEKIAIVGRNGIGKSSMLKALLDKIPVESGTILWGRNTEVSYFDQEDENIDKNKTVLEDFWDSFPREERFSIRSVLGHAGLSGDEVDKSVGDLSGGERARLKFAKIMMEQGNVILLDEPTNHLDLPTNEVLDTALEDYGGTLLVVSHDRYLLNKFPDKIIEVTDSGVDIYHGKYDDYAAEKLKEREIAEGKSREKREEKPEEDKNLSTSFRTKEQRQRSAFRRKRLGELEKSILTLEEESGILKEEAGKPEIMSDYQELEIRFSRIEEIRIQLEEHMKEWGELGLEEEEL